MNSGLTGALCSAPLRASAAKRIAYGSVLLTTSNRGALILENIGSGSFDDSNVLQLSGFSRLRRGVNAVDLSTSRSAIGSIASGGCSTISGGSNNTASGSGSAVAGGVSNISSGAYTFTAGSGNTASSTGATVPGGSSNTATASYSCVIGGTSNTATAIYSIASGARSIANRMGQKAHAAGFFAAQGDAQVINLVARVSTASTSQVELTLDGAAATGSAVTTANRIIIEANTTLMVDAQVVWRDSSGNSGPAHRRCVIKRDGSSNTVLVSSVQTIGTDFDETGGAAVTLAADNTNESLQVLVTPFNATTTRWVADIRATIVGH